MELILDSKPYLLYETVSMLFSYVNNISILSARDRIGRTCRGSYDDAWYRRLGRLQEITEDCCRDLDLADETVQHFFRQMSTGNSSQYVCLACLMTIAFMQFRQHGLEEEAQALKAYWQKLQEEGYQLVDSGAYGPGIGPLKQGKKQQKLNQQIYNLQYPAELRLELLNTLMDYDSEMDRLVELLRPYAQRLETHLQAEPWLMETTTDYWQKQFEVTTPETFFRQMDPLNREAAPAEENCRVCFLLMNCAYMFLCVSDEQPQNKWLLVIGCAILREGTARCGGDNLDWVLSVLRSISDRNKFELLRRLSREQSYCQKLAEELGCHPGNVSRNLTALWKEGFLIRQEGESRIYYKTDPERIKVFLRGVQELLTDEPS